MWGVCYLPMSLCTLHLECLWARGAILVLLPATLFCVIRCSFSGHPGGKPWFPPKSAHDGTQDSGSSLPSPDPLPAPSWTCFSFRKVFLLSSFSHIPAESSAGGHTQKFFLPFPSLCSLPSLLFWEWSGGPCTHQVGLLYRAVPNTLCTVALLRQKPHELCRWILNLNLPSSCFSLLCS